MCRRNASPVCAAIVWSPRAVLLYASLHFLPFPAATRRVGAAREPPRPLSRGFLEPGRPPWRGQRPVFRCQKTSFYEERSVARNKRKKIGKGRRRKEKNGGGMKQVSAEQSLSCLSQKGHLIQPPKIEEHARRWKRRASAVVFPTTKAVE